MMKLDTIIGNPPYQEFTGGGGYIPDSMPLYNEFMMHGMDVSNQYVTFLVPSRWLAGGKSVLNYLRNRIVNDKHMKYMCNYERSVTIFPDLSISGGIHYMLIDMKNVYEYTTVRTIGTYGEDIGKPVNIKLDKYNYLDNSNEQQYMIITDPIFLGIISKINSKYNGYMVSDTMLNVSPFGIEVNFIGNDTLTDKFNVKVRCSNGRETYISEDDIRKNREYINTYKVFTGKMNPDRGGARILSDDKRLVINKPQIAFPKEVVTHTHMVLYSSNRLENCEKFKKYIETKFARYLIYKTISGMHIIKKNYQFVPCIVEDAIGSKIDWSKSIEDTDKQLYKLFDLNSIEIGAIENSIRYLSNKE